MSRILNIDSIFHFDIFLNLIHFQRMRFLQQYRGKLENLLLLEAM